MRDNHFTIPEPISAGTELEFLHFGKADKTNAYQLGDEIILRLRVSRSVGADECCLVLFDEYLSRAVGKIQGVFSRLSSGFDEYIFDLTSVFSSAALRFFHIILTSADEVMYVKRSVKPFITRNASLDDMFQLTVSDFKYPKPDSAEGGIIYHVFVDRFMRGGNVPIKSGAVLVDGEWEYIPEFPEYPGAPLKNNTFYGGTLYGILSKLDYLCSLGVSIIYLSPIFSSPSNHKYDTADYMSVDEMFGGDEALKKLLIEADKRGLKIILDGVFNHTGDDSIYFNRYSNYDSQGAYNTKDSPYYPWYDFQSHPDKYTCWWDIPILPRINPDIPECGDFIAGEGGVLDKYVKMGVYGFRLDVADELSDKFLARIKERISQRGESLLYGEVWEDASNKIAYGVRKKYFQGAELDGVMNYPVRVGLIDYLVNKNPDKLRYALTDVLYNTPARIRNIQMNLIGSHDTVRAISALSGVSADGKSNAEKRVMRLSESDYAHARARLMSAYTVLATIPGIPSIFYGDEAGLEGYGDPFCRMPYPWGKEDNIILDHYRRVGCIRRSSDVYADGDFNLLYLDGDLLIFSRSGKKADYITILNNSQHSLKISFDSQITDTFLNKRTKSVNIKSESSVIIKAKKDISFEIFFNN